MSEHRTEPAAVELNEFSGPLRALFRLAQIRLHSGGASDWIIDCSVLTEDDLRCLARLAHRSVGPWGPVEGVPRGGLPLAEACRELSTDGPLLIVDDVCTTGASLEDQRQDRRAHGIVIFSRGVTPLWVTPLFLANPAMSRVG